MAPMARGEPLRGLVLPLKNEVEVTAAPLDEEEKGILVVRLVYLLFHVRHAFHGLTVYIQDQACFPCLF